MSNLYRICVACRRLLPRSELLQFTISRTQQSLSINQHPFLLGRSAYLCKQLPCIYEAQKGKKIQRALKSNLSGDIVETLNIYLSQLLTEKASPTCENT